MTKYLEDHVLNLTAGTLLVLRWLIIAFAACAAMASFALAVAAIVPAIQLIEPGQEYIALLMPTAVVMLALTAWFIKLLRDLIISVGQGQPLTTANAGRLRMMGWLTLAGQAAVLLAAVAIGWQGNTNMLDFDAAFDLTEALIMAAVLFILARVFEYGAKMQEELEGTI
jgi:energy-converting hydrogenase Eha subunit A